MRTTVSLDHPLLLALAPALGYGVAFLDRLGEAAFYGIPTDYIALSWTDALSRTALVVVVVATFVLVARAEDQLKSRLPGWASGSLDGGAAPLLVFAVFALVLGGSLRIAIIFLIATIVSVLVRLDLKGMRDPHLKPPASRVQQSPVVLEHKSTEDWQPRVRATFLLAVISSALAFAFLGGNLRADAREQYLVTGDAKATVLLASYAGNKAVCGDVLPGTHVLGDVRQYISLPSSDASQTFTWIPVGRLSWPGGFRAFGWLDSLQR